MCCEVLFFFFNELILVLGLKLHEEAIFLRLFFPLILVCEVI